MRALIRLISLIVPRASRERWREEWLAELQHGGWRMLAGAVPDAWALRRLASSRGRRSRRPLHALGKDVRYSVRSLVATPGFTLGVVLSLAVGIATTSAAFGLFIG